jgi:hypothetical protein
MSRFAQSAKGATSSQPTTSNEAGGDAFTMTPRMALATQVLTCVLADSAYKNRAKGHADIKALVAQLHQAGDLAFAAQTALYARHVHGLRTISHVLAGEIALVQSNTLTWRTGFFPKVVKRPDDALEIAAYVLAARPDKRLPNALTRGLAKALLKFDEQSLAKWDKDKAGLRLVDLANLTHPKAPKKHALHLLMKGTLPTPVTWETQLSAAGSSEDPAKAKAQVWEKLLTDDSLGYMALVMNLRNIILQAPKAVPLACEVLADEERVRKSLLLPTQFMSAYAALQGMDASADSECVRAVTTTLGQAMEMAAKNVPSFTGRTLIALDGSGSMGSGGLFTHNPFAIGALFTAMLLKANHSADYLCFSDHARFLRPNPEMPIMDLATWLDTHRNNGGTNFHSIFDAAAKAYDRVIILSDMQAWMTSIYDSSNATATSLAAYQRRTGANPMIVAFDLQGSGTAQFPAKRVCQLAGWSEKVFDLIPMLESDPQALITEILKQSV